jgi:hypothetical protein
MEMLRAIIKGERIAPRQSPCTVRQSFFMIIGDAETIL